VNHGQTARLASRGRKTRHRRLPSHVLLCTGPKCCTPEDGEPRGTKLKKQIKDQNLADSCYRTKVGCLRICCHGPTMLVYPEGTGITA